MLRHTLANGLAADVADTAPALAAVSLEMQSVFMRGAIGHMVKTQAIAHNSAAAAVDMRVGGVPFP